MSHPGYAVHHLVFDHDDSGALYTANQGNWWAFRQWVSIGQSDHFTDYGPSIVMPRSLLPYVPPQSIEVYQGKTVLTGGIFQKMVQQYPGIFKLSVDSEIQDFVLQYQKGKGRGKGKQYTLTGSSRM